MYKTDYVQKINAILSDSERFIYIGQKRQKPGKVSKLLELIKKRKTPR